MNYHIKQNDEAPQDSSAATVVTVEGISRKLPLIEYVPAFAARKLAETAILIEIDRNTYKLKCENLTVLHRELLGEIVGIWKQLRVKCGCNSNRRCWLCTKEDPVRMMQSIRRFLKGQTAPVLADLQLSPRSVNCLMRAGIQTTKQLRKYNREQLLKLEGMGRKTVNEIMDALEQNNPKHQRP